MSKLSHHSSLEAMKASSIFMPSTAAVVAARYAKFEEFINGLKAEFVASTVSPSAKASVSQEKEHGS